jgi:hypothetical protein
MRSYILLIIISLFYSCAKTVSMNDCIKCNSSISIRNSNYAYNCGLEKVSLTDKKDIKFFCEQMNKLEALSSFTQVNRSRGYIELNYKNSPRVSVLTFVLGRNNKVERYVFNIGTGKFYRNDTLAQFLIKKMEIKDINSSDSCKFISPDYYDLTK